MPIPYDDFGGRGPVLHFSHPNAYTPGSFRQFLIPLTERYHVLSAHHRPLWHLHGATGRPEAFISWDWDPVARDLVNFLEEHQLENVIGVGHSLGAVATMIAAKMAPARFRALVLLDPVFLPPAWLELAQANPAAAASQPFAVVARRRRDRWPDRQAAYDHFREKRAFAQWDNDVLWDFIHYGLFDDPATGEAVLMYPKDWEAWFYSRPPVNVWEEVPKISHPTLGVRASDSNTLTAEAWSLWQTLQPAATFVEMDGVGHMLTAEAPQDTAAVILHWLEDKGL